MKLLMKKKIQELLMELYMIEKAITNIGEEDLIVVLWANEVFDDSNPDTYYSEVNKIET